MSYSIHHLLECAPNYMSHIDQSWCTPWHDNQFNNLEIKDKGYRFLWWANSTHGNCHTFKRSHPSFLQTWSRHQLKTWNVERTFFWGSRRCIHEDMQICIATNYRWVWMEVALLPQDQWCNLMVNAWARFPHFSFQTHPWILGTKKEFHVDVIQHLVKENHK
jgi:hypothetical protein